MCLRVAGRRDSKIEKRRSKSEIRKSKLENRNWKIEIRNRLEFETRWDFLRQRTDSVFQSRPFVAFLAGNSKFETHCGFRFSLFAFRFPIFDFRISIFEFRFSSYFPARCRRA